MDNRFAASPDGAGRIRARGAATLVCLLATMPAPALDFIGSQTSEETANTRTHALRVNTLPVQAGDLLVAQLCADGGTGTLSCPAGWTQLRSVSSTGMHVGGAVCHKQAGAADTAGSAYSWTTGYLQQSQGGVMLFRGQDPSNPVAASAMLNNQNDRSPLSPALAQAPPAGSSLLRLMCADGGSVTEGAGFPTGMAANLWVLESANGADGPVSGGAAIARAGASGSAQWTNALAIARESVNFTVAIRAANSLPPNQPPLAHAGADITVTDSDANGSETVTLDGSGSTDPDGVIVSWAWTEAGVTHAATSSANIAFTPGTHALTLTVRDNSGNSASDTMTVRVNSSVPVAEVANPALVLFHIGHSLTDRMADLLNDIVEQQSGQSLLYSYKSIPGSTLYYHWQYPTSGRKGNIQTGTPMEILTSGMIDALILTESQAIESHIHSATRNSTEHANYFLDAYLGAETPPDHPQLYIYSTWETRRVPVSSDPSNPDAPWINWEDTPESIANFIQKTVERQALWEELADALQGAHPGVTVRVIPGGLVLVELQRRVLASTLLLPDGLSFREVFFKKNKPGRYGGCAVRDHIHLSATGIWVIALTHYMTIYGSWPPDGFDSTILHAGTDECGDSNSIEIDPAFAAELQSIIWSVVSTYPHSRPNP